MQPQELLPERSCLLVVHTAGHTEEPAAVQAEPAERVPEQVLPAVWKCLLFGCVTLYKAIFVAVFGDIYYADLSPVVGSEQGGMRPVLIVQNDIGNKHSPTVIAAAITSRLDKAKLPTHIEVGGGTCGLAKDSVVLLEQIRTLDKKRLKEKMGTLDVSSMSAVNSALSISFGLKL